jgi:hypothetical protein
MGFLSLAAFRRFNKNSVFIHFFISSPLIFLAGELKISQLCLALTHTPEHH